jgi:hypothetical protein
MGKSKAVSSHRSPRNQDPEFHAKARNKRKKEVFREFRSPRCAVTQDVLGHEGVLECSGLTELWMGRERDDGEIQSGVKPPQSKKPGSGISREDAKARRVGDRVPQLPMTFCGNEGDLECSGLTELWMGIERVDGKIPSGVQPPQSKKPGSGLNFLKMITLASSRETPSPSA